MKKEMTVGELFKAQDRLDQVIVDNLLTRPSRDQLINDKMMATMVEVGEMANEHRGFKYWSAKGPNEEKLKEEYIDVLHFVLSLGNEIFYSNHNEIIKKYIEKNVINHQRQQEGY